jgi:hypothetical protein
MKREYHAPPFASLPILDGGSGERWVGSTVMDEEQYRVERWEATMVGPHEYWRASSEGMESYHALRKGRREDRKAAWQARQEADDEWSAHVESLVGPA